MISFEEAYGIVMSSQPTAVAERVPLMTALGRILAEDITADLDMPPFDKAAVDGFACRRADLGSLFGSSGSGHLTQNSAFSHGPSTPEYGDRLKVIETIPAGKVPLQTIGTGECSRIMTGAMIPEGADCVVMVEETEETEPELIRVIKTQKSPNICYRAEDIRKGSGILTKGTLLDPAGIASLATVGITSPLVSVQPSVGIISTGDELVEPDTLPGLSQIRNSNSWQLMAQLMAMGIRANYHGIAKDTATALRDKIENACQNNRVVLLTGGVSMGDYDYVPQVMTEAGFKLKFRSLAVQPGKPTVFGHRDDRWFFGLPGNPVSSFVIFEMLVKPFLYRLMGHQWQPLELIMPVSADYTRRRAERKAMVPVKITGGTVSPVEYHGSAHIHSYTMADGIMIVERGVNFIKKGDPVNVRPV